MAGSWLSADATNDAAETRLSTADMILVEAAALFQSKGYLRTTTRDLGTAVGIRGPSVYHHYKRKEDILYDICLLSLGRLTERVAPALEIEDPLERVRAFVKLHVVNLLEDRNMHATVLTEISHLSPEHREYVTAQRDAYEGLIRDAVKQAQDAGAIRGDVPANQITLALLSLLNWTIFWYRPDGPLDTTEIGDLLATMFLDGARPR